MAFMWDWKCSAMHAATVAAHKIIGTDLWAPLTATAMPMPDVMVVLQVSCPV